MRQCTKSALPMIFQPSGTFLGKLPTMSQLAHTNRIFYESSTHCI